MDEVPETEQQRPSTGSVESPLWQRRHCSQSQRKWLCPCRSFLRHASRNRMQLILSGPEHTEVARRARVGTCMSVRGGYAAGAGCRVKIKINTTEQTAMNPELQTAFGRLRSGPIKMSPWDLGEAKTAAKMLQVEDWMISWEAGRRAVRAAPCFVARLS